MSRSTERPWIVIVSLFLLTASGLALEVSLTRLFSFLFVQSYVYILISLSIAGVGLGAVLMHYLSPRARLPVIGSLPLLPPILLLLLFLGNSGSADVIYSLLLTFVIYMGLGAVQVHIFKESGITVSTLYGADLLGAATGSILAFYLLNGVGGVDALAVVVTVMALGTTGVFYFFSRKSMRAVAVSILLLVLGGGLASYPFESSLMPLGTWEKEMTAMLREEGTDAKISESRWSAFGRVDVVETNNPLFKTMFIDGGAGTKMVQMEGGTVTREVARTLMLQYMGGIPLLATDREQREEAVVIGSGGGIDVVTLLVAGYQSIDAVEINPEFIEIVREQSAYTGGIYNQHPRVTVHNTEGRSFLRTSDKRYDLVLMGLPIIKSVRNFGNHALTENYLFTHNAFTEYRRALKPGGMLIVVAHYENELLRLLSNALKSFENGGLTLQEASKRVVTLGDRQNPTLIIKNEPFGQEERAAYLGIMEAINTKAGTNFVPGNSESAQRLGFNGPLLDVEAGSMSLAGFAAQAEENISWISDDSPFFYQLSGSLPREMRIVVFAVCLLLLLIIVLFLLDSRRRKLLSESQPDGAGLLRFAAFGALGVGFITVEIAFLQKFIVFWQHQTLALAVVLSAILVASGLGSLLSRKLAGSRRLLPLVGVELLLLLVAAVALGPLLLRLESAGRVTKLVVTVAVVLPVFLPLGMPFPTMLKESREDRYPWMIGINSTTTLLGGVAATIIALEIGYRFVMVTGMAAYVLFMLAVYRQTRILREG